MEGIEGGRNEDGYRKPPPPPPLSLHYPPRVGDEEILTGEMGTAGGKLQTRETVQTEGRGRTGRTQRGEKTETGKGGGGVELFLGGKDEDGGRERN